MSIANARVDIARQEQIPDLSDIPQTVWTEQDPFIDRIPRWVAMAGLFLVIVGIWYAVTAFEFVSPIILPGPAETGADILFVGKNILDGGYVLDALITTSLTVLYGFLIAVAIGFSLGVLVGETKFGERAVMPYLVAIDTMPKVAFRAIVHRLAGIRHLVEGSVGSVHCHLPDRRRHRCRILCRYRNERLLFKSMGATRWQILVGLKLPTGLPYLFTGLKIAAVGVMAGAITGEFLGGGKGFGALIRVSASQLNTPRVFSLIIYLSLLGLSLYLLIVWLQRRLVFWNRKDNLTATA